MKWFLLKRGQIIGGPWSRGLDAYDAMYNHAETHPKVLALSDPKKMEAIESIIAHCSLVEASKNQRPLEFYAWRTLWGPAYQHFARLYGDAISDAANMWGTFSWAVIRKRPHNLHCAATIDLMVRGIRDPQNNMKPLRGLQVFDLSLSTPPELIIMRCLVRTAR